MSKSSKRCNAGYNIGFLFSVALLWNKGNILKYIVMFLCPFLDACWNEDKPPKPVCQRQSSKCVFVLFMFRKSLRLLMLAWMNISMSTVIQPYLFSGLGMVIEFFSPVNTVRLFLCDIHVLFIPVDLRFKCVCDSVCFFVQWTMQIA